MVLASVLLLSACGSKEEILYSDQDEHEEAGHGAYTPIGRSTSPRVHKDGAHHPADDVAVGSGHTAAYTPIAGSDSLLVHTDGKPRSVPNALLAHEKAGMGSSAPYPVSTPRVTTSGAAARPGGLAQAAPSPTAAPRLNLGTGLGASASAPKPGSIPVLMQDDGSDELATVAGRVESIIGTDITVKSPAGLARVRLAERARVDRDALGTATDLKPGQFVGAVQQLGGPATSVRLYATGPSTPRAGIVPMIGSRNGQVTTFGSVVTLQFGGLLLNTGGATTTVTLPAGVEILKPAPADASALAVGAQVIATGTMSTENILMATAVRITGEARPGR
jgi:hypothetical protein